MISRGIPLPKFVPEECLHWKVCSMVIRVSVIDCLRYLELAPPFINPRSAPVPGDLFAAELSTR